MGTNNDIVGCDGAQRMWYYLLSKKCFSVIIGQFVMDLNIKLNRKFWKIGSLLRAAVVLLASAFETISPIHNFYTHIKHTERI